MGKILTMPNPIPDLPPMQMWCRMLVSMSDDDIRRLYATALEATTQSPFWQKHLVTVEDELKVRKLSL